MTILSESQPEEQADINSAGPLAIGGWVLFDWAAQPFYTLILTFLFAPYFANVFIGNPEHGQALWGYGAAVAGLMVAIFGPVLGAVADASGRRKPWVAIFSVVMIVGMSLLWLAEPGGQSSVYVIIFAFVMASIAAEFTTIFTNSMMSSLVPSAQLGRLSGAGWAVGYAGGLVSLVIMAGLIVANPATGKTLLGLDPLLNLDHSTREGDRLVGPFSALWYFVFVIPFFLFTPDNPGPKRQISAAVSEGLSVLKNTILSLKDYRNILLFLIARMLYVDGLAAIFVFGGIYASAIFGWSSFELGLFGILLALTGAIGALLGGMLDDKLGSKLVIIGALVGLIFAALGILSVDKTHIFYIVEAAEKSESDAIFSSLGERIYLAFAVLIGLVAGPLQAASRTLLARLAPKDKMAEFFGLYAFSGKVTSFLAPFFVGFVTQMANSQRIGISVIMVFLLAGLTLLSLVKER